MKKTIKIFLITILALTALKVHARTYSVDEVKYNIADQIIENSKKYTDAELQVNVVALPFQNLNLPDGKVKFAVTSFNDKFSPRDLKKVVVSVDGKPQKIFNVPVEIKAYKDVLVASSFLEREKMLTKGDVLTQRKEISTMIEYALTDDTLKKDVITKKAFRAGEIIDRRFVRLKPDVQRNNSVTAYFSNDNLTVSIDATALSDGMIGEYIGVENKAYKKVYTGKIIGENKVLIQL